MKVISIPINEDLQNYAINSICGSSVLVFPTRAAADHARHIHRGRKGLQDSLFLSMEDFKDCLILPDNPVLMDEKRLLSLYLVMGEELREFFHLLSYADVIEWGNRFFTFFEELAEEGIDPATLEEKKDAGDFYMQMWQETYLEKILQIRCDYQSYISALGFTDKIFYTKEESIVIPWENRQVIFVNQYYYSNIEKLICGKLEESGNAVTVLYHGLRVSEGNESWKAERFNLGDTLETMVDKPVIKVIQCENEDQMALSFLAMHAGDVNDAAGVIIDSSFYAKSYSAYFDADHFRFPNAIPMSNTNLYQMLNGIHQGVLAMSKTGGYLPMALLNKLLSAQWFMAYYIPGISELQINSVWLEVNALMQNDFLYVDEHVFDSESKSCLRIIVCGFISMVRSFTAIKNISQLCALIDSPGVLELDRLITAQESEYTDIKSCFWERIANFAAIDKMEIVPTWTEVYKEEGCGAGLLELLLSFIKSAMLSYRKLDKPNKQWEISNLLDSRNRTFSRVAFFQLIEGLLPGNPSPVWLFNETQRLKLGLKSYSDIREWERYYFLRLVLSTQEVQCYTYKNLERDISPSSFLGELMQYEGLLEISNIKPVVKMKDIYSQLLAASAGSWMQDAATIQDCCFQPLPEKDFFSLPANPEKDIPEGGILKASASGILQFIRNPFLWYLEYKSNISNYAYEAEETISPKLFGNIMHAYFAGILGAEAGKHDGLDRLERLFGDADTLQVELGKLLNSPQFKYQIPKNYNADFLTEIIAAKLAESLNQFFSKWLKQNLQNRSFVLIPESEQMTKQERKYRKLGAVMVAGKEYSVALHGKADLRIETEYEAMIIDFKTGNRDVRQLIIYEWVYYLLDGIMPEDRLKSIFWNILDTKEMRENISPEKRENLKTEILDTFVDCLQHGYGQGKKGADRQRLQHISRSDLLPRLKEARDV